MSVIEKCYFPKFLKRPMFHWGYKIDELPTPILFVHDMNQGRYDTPVFSGILNFGT